MMALPDKAKQESSWQLLGYSPMARLFRSDKTEWMPTVGYDSCQQADVDIAAYIRYYHHRRGHSYNQYLSPTAAEAA